MVGLAAVPTDSTGRYCMWGVGLLGISILFFFIMLGKNFFYMHNWTPSVHLKCRPKLTTSSDQSVEKSGNFTQLSLKVYRLICRQKS